MSSWTQEEWTRRLIKRKGTLTFASFSEMGTRLEDLELIEGLEDSNPVLWKTVRDARTSAFLAANEYMGAARDKSTGAVLFLKQPKPGTIIEVEAAWFDPQLSLVEQAELSGALPHSSGWLGSNLALVVVAVGALGSLLWIGFQGKSKVGR
jgi:hypothetical protein